ncbi:MAG: acyl-CoA dehydrogenase family protein [Pseudomonadota bacterium]|nr:acyl-CoA dehydrogenase family protein [Pseudomonadota bacterium]
MPKAESAELQQFRSEVANWLQENRPPLPDFPLPQSFTEVGNNDQFEYLRDWQQKVYEAGYLGMAWPAEYGGGGKPQEYQDIVNQEMVKARTPLMVNAVGLSWAGPTILTHGTEEQKKKYIRPILSAEEIWCQGFSEPDHGSDLGNVQTKAVKDESTDEYVLNGRKIWTTLGEQAKHMILLARTNPDAPNKYAGLSFFLAPMNVDGVEVLPIKKITHEYGFNETVFTNARIQADSLMGKEGEGWFIAMTVLTFERGVTGGQAGGNLMEIKNVNDVYEVAKGLFRDGRPALDDPSLRSQLIDLFITERAHRLHNKRMDHAPLLVPERAAGMGLFNKLVMSEDRHKLAEFAVRMQGNAAALYADDTDAVAGGLWQHARLAAFAGSIGGGTTEVQRNIIAERVLGLPKSR